jgi:hypothetical protein
MNGSTGIIETKDCYITYQDGLVIEKGSFYGDSETKYRYINLDSIGKARLKSKETKGDEWKPAFRKIA